jgi:carboxyl-terminal processing protease
MLRATETKDKKTGKIMNIPSRYLKLAFASTLAGMMIVNPATGASSVPAAHTPAKHASPKKAPVKTSVVKEKECAAQDLPPQIWSMIKVMAAIAQMHVDEKNATDMYKMVANARKAIPAISGEASEKASKNECFPLDMPLEMLPVWQMGKMMNASAEAQGDKDNALNKMTTDALKEILKGLDPHSDYLPSKEFNDMMTEISGRFAGIGIEVGIDEGTRFLKVMKPTEGGPAERAGIKAGALITHVDYDDAAIPFIDSETSIRKIRGEANTPVTLTILQEGVEKRVTLVRQEIKTLPVTFSKIGDIGVINLSNFMYQKTDDTGAIIEGPNEENSATLVRDAILALEKQNVRAYILNLRDNRGGNRRFAVDVASFFLGSDKVVLDQRGRMPGSNEILKTDSASTDLTNGKPLIVLENGFTVSASEIDAGALQDHNRATIMGTQSFGKGSVQMVIPMQDETPSQKTCLPEDKCSALKLTIARYFSPNGYGVQNKGITPDILYEEATPSGPTIRESNLLNALPDGSDKPNPHETSATCRLAAKDTPVEAFDKAVIGLDGKPDGMLLCAIETLQGKSEYTITTPYAAPMQTPVLSQ